MKNMETICNELKNVPYMKLKQAEIMRQIIVKNKLKNALEIGFYHGKSSVLLAAIFEEIGEGHLITYDVESAINREPNIIQLLDAYSLSHRVTPVFCKRSFTWELGKMIKDSKRNIFDFCYLDGAHTWDNTGFGFYLIDLLLKPGGVIIFDDLNWTINKSPAYQKSLKEGKDTYNLYSEDEKETPGVRMVFDCLISESHYERMEIKELDWGIAFKR